jgi:hypothetical protein
VLRRPHIAPGARGTHRPQAARSIAGTHRTRNSNPPAVLRSRRSHSRCRV